MQSTSRPAGPSERDAGAPDQCSLLIPLNPEYQPLYKAARRKRED
jgi:hypothetical protein